jgi:hypothetical protein
VYLIPPERTQVVSASEIRVQVNVTGQAAGWTAEVMNPDGRVSGRWPFTVTAPAPPPAPALVARPVAVKYVVTIENRSYTVEDAGGEGQVFRDDRGNPVTDLSLARKIALVAYVKEKILTKKLYDFQQEISAIETAIRMAGRIAYLEAARDFLARAFVEAIALYGTAGTGALSPSAIVGSITARTVIDTLKDPRTYLGSVARNMAKAAVDRYQRVITEATQFLQTHRPLDDRTATNLYRNYIGAVRLGYPSVVLLGDLSGLDQRWYNDLFNMGRAASDEILKLVEDRGGIVDQMATANEIRKGLEDTEKILGSLPPFNNFSRNLRDQVKLTDKIGEQIERHAARAVQLGVARLQTPQPQPTPVQPPLP